MLHNQSKFQHLKVTKKKKNFFFGTKDKTDEVKNVGPLI